MSRPAQPPRDSLDLMAVLCSSSCSSRRSCSGGRRPPLITCCTRYSTVGWGPAHVPRSFPVWSTISCFCIIFSTQTFLLSLTWILLFICLLLFWLRPFHLRKVAFKYKGLSICIYVCVCVCVCIHIYFCVYFSNIFCNISPPFKMSYECLQQNNCRSMRYLCLYFYYSTPFFFYKKSCFSYRLSFLRMKIISIL